jgi:hypothetical protein
VSNSPVLNRPDTAFDAQAVLNARDLEMICNAISETGVVSGCAVTTTGAANGSVNVASGLVRIAYRVVQVGSATVQVTANSSGSPRMDLITVDTSGAAALVVGTPGALPLLPAIPASRVVLESIYVANGHTTSTTLAADRLTDKRVILPASDSLYHNVLHYGAVGTNDTSNVNAVDCTQAFVDAADAANLCIQETLKSDLNGTGLVLVPGNRDYKMTATIQWPENVRMIGGTGTGSGVAHPPRIRWHGDAGLTMFQHRTTNPNIVGIHVNNIKFDGRSADGSGYAGYGNGAATAWAFGPVTPGGSGGKIDTGCDFTDVHIGNCHGNAVVIDQGATNWSWMRGRIDQIGGYAFYLLARHGFYGTIADMTYDNWAMSDPSHNGRSKGFLFIDGEGAQAGDTKAWIGLHDLHLEVNGGLAQTYVPTAWSPTGCDTRGLIRLGVSPDNPNVVQHVIEMDHVWVPVNPATNAFSVFQMTSTDLTTDQRVRHASAARILLGSDHALSNGSSSSQDSAGAVKLIGGVLDEDNYPWMPSTNGVRQPDLVRWAPEALVSGFPANERSVVYFHGRNVATSWEYRNRATAPGTPDMGPVVYGSSGDLKVKTTGGNVVTLPNTKPTVSGSRGGNAALADLLTELAALGLITDSTSA